MGWVRRRVIATHAYHVRRVVRRVAYASDACAQLALACMCAHHLRACVSCTHQRGGGVRRRGGAG
eukprot:5052868-Pyramimonas_sp.AAC.1